MDMWNKPHGLLFFAGFLAAFTGYPGIALVVSHELIMKFIAYGAALLSNWASMMKLKFFSETTNKAFFAQGLEQLAHLITARLLEIRSKTGATNPEREEYDALSDLSKIVNKMIQNHREQTGEKSMLTTCTAKADRGLASGISGAVEYVGGALSSATTYCGSFLGWGTRASAAAESYSPV